MLGHPAAYSYYLQSANEIVLNLESPNGKAGYFYPKFYASLINLTVINWDYNGYFYQPQDGQQVEIDVIIKDGLTTLSTPEFADDLAVYLYIETESD